MSFREKQMGSSPVLFRNKKFFRTVANHPPFQKGGGWGNLALIPYSPQQALPRKISFNNSIKHFSKWKSYTTALSLHHGRSRAENNFPIKLSSYLLRIRKILLEKKDNLYIAQKLIEEK